MKTNLVKTGFYCLGGVFGAMCALVPMQAFASGGGGIGWEPGSMLGNTNVSDSSRLTTGSFDQGTLFNWVQRLTNWALGIGVVLFVLKVVLTAIDRMVFDPDKGGGGGGGMGGPGGGGGRGGGGRQGSGESVLSRIPIIGAYDPSMSWKEIWKSFGKNIAIVAGAWVLVNLVIQIVMWAFGVLTNPDGN